MKARCKPEMKTTGNRIRELRLSEAAVEKRILREADGEVLSRWMEQDRCGDVLKLSWAYCTDIYAESVSYRNAIRDSSAFFLPEHGE